MNDAVEKAQDICEHFAAIRDQYHTKYCAKAKCMEPHANALRWVHAQKGGPISPEGQGPSNSGEIGPESHRSTQRRAFACASMHTNANFTENNFANGWYRISKKKVPRML